MGSFSCPLQSWTFPCLRRRAARSPRHAGGPCRRFRRVFTPRLTYSLENLFWKGFVICLWGRQRETVATLISRLREVKERSPGRLTSEWQSEDIPFLNFFSRVFDERPLPCGDRTDDCVRMKEEPGGLHFARPSKP